VVHRVSDTWVPLFASLCVLCGWNSKIIKIIVNIKVRMPCNYILPEHDDMVSLVFQTEPNQTDAPIP